MMSLASKTLCLVALCAAIPARVVKNIDQSQQLLGHQPQVQATRGSRALTGKFLHITDIHPDPFYKIGSDSNEEACHRGYGGNTTGYYGAPTTSCDTPFTLVDATFRWIKTNLKDEIDFVVWTGDSARHDNDEAVPRDPQLVEDLNRYVVAKFVETFKEPKDADGGDPRHHFVVPIVPTLGNNDILPHNILFPGPNQWTRDYLSIWKKFIPEQQNHVFVHGAYFWTEVIPNKLAVISLNTMYFFDNNAAVDGCDMKSEPGYEQMEWLRVQLQIMRERGLKAIMIGHVPPARTATKASWTESCYQKYILWLRQYRDVIVANIYGHMNIDHFMLHDANDVIYQFESESFGYDDEDDDDDNSDDDSAEYKDDRQKRDSRSDGLALNGSNTDHSLEHDCSILAGANYLAELRDRWNDLPTPPKGTTYASLSNCADLQKKKRRNKKKEKEKEKSKEQFIREIGGLYGERFSLSIVSPSVVPNYFPTLRVIEYNISGLENNHPASGAPGGPSITENDLFDQKKKHKDKKRKKDKHHKNPRIKPRFPVPLPPAMTSPPGPAYSPQTFSLLSWTQLYANLTSIHEAMATASEAAHEDPYSYFDYKTEYTTNRDDMYKMRDLTVRHWLDTAEKISRAEYKEGGRHSLSSTGHLFDHEESDDLRSKAAVECKRRSSGKLRANALWHEFVKRAFVYSKGDADLMGDFD